MNLSHCPPKPAQKWFPGKQKRTAVAAFQVQKELLLPPGNTAVQVYLFESEELYKSYMKARYPDLPSRRAERVRRAS